GAHLELHLRYPERGVEVTQPALPLLQLRLEEIDGVAGARVPLGVLGQLLLEERGRVLAPYLLEHLRLELGVEHLVADEVAGVEEGGLHLELPRGQPAALADVAERVPDREAGVPERVED